MRRVIIQLFLASICVALLVAVAPLYSGLGVKLVEGSYDLGGARSFSELPLVVREENFSVRVRMQVLVSRFHADYFTIQPDNCLEDLVVNGTSLKQAILRPCSFPHGEDINLGAYLKVGLNEIETSLTNSGGPGGLEIRISNTDPKLLLLHVLTLVAVISLSAILILPYFQGSKSAALPAIFLVGVALRCVYLAGTPHSVRAHDWSGHQEYIQYVVNNWSIPKSSEGWEFYHPPLYYFIGAVCLKIGEYLGHTGTRFFLDLQLLSLLLSVATLWLALLISRELFEERPTEKLLFMSIVSTFPGLIFFSARINNDVLFLFWSFLAILFLIKWWKSPSRRDWIFLNIVIGCGLLTKNNMLLLVPALYGALVLKAGLPFRDKLTLGLGSVGILAIMAGWLTALRYVEGPELAVIGNVKSLNSALIVSNDWSSFVTFNPLRILKIPFNNPWEDQSGRQYFFEYFFRSSFFGEFNFGENFEWLAHVLYVLGMIALMFVLSGLLLALREKKSWPLNLILFFGIALHLVHRTRNPFSSVQDFRFVPFLIVPLVYFCIDAATYLKYPFREALGFVLAGISILSAVLILILYLEKVPFYI